MNGIKGYYIHVNETRDEPNASSKARNDAEIIAGRCGLKPFCFQTPGSAQGKFTAQARMILSYEQDWKLLHQKVSKDDVVLIQYPLFPLKLTSIARSWVRKIYREKGTRFIALIHDLDSLRHLHGVAAGYSDKSFLPEFQHVICHNDSMKEYLVKQGIPADRLVPLQLFDYLTDAEPRKHQLQDGIAIAGNLNPGKSGYILKLLQNIEGSIPIHLYGTGLPDTTSLHGAIYHGVIVPDELPGRIEGAFGLIWDGPSIEACEGGQGEYLKYNSPHKASLYVAAGMPMLIWNRAGLAPYIQKKRLGIPLNSIMEMTDTMTFIKPDEYELYIRSVAKEKESIEGELLSGALEKLRESTEKW